MFPSETACLKMSVDIIGVNTETEMCICPTDLCNNKPVKNEMPAGHPVSAINEQDFTGKGQDINILFVDVFTIFSSGFCFLNYTVTNQLLHYASCNMITVYN